MNQTQILNIIQKILVAGGSAGAGAALQNMNLPQTKQGWQQLALSGLVAGLGVIWSHLTHADSPASPPATPGGGAKTLVVAGILLFGVATLTPGCASTGQGGFTAGIGTNGLFASYRTATATNRFKFVVPVNPAALLQGFMATEGF